MTLPRSFHSFTNIEQTPSRKHMNVIHVELSLCSPPLMAVQVKNGAIHYWNNSIITECGIFSRRGGGVQSPCRFGPTTSVDQMAPALHYNPLMCKRRSCVSLPAQDLDLHIFRSRMMMATRCDTSPDRRNTFILIVLHFQKSSTQLLRYLPRLQSRVVHSHRAKARRSSLPGHDSEMTG